MKSNWSTLLVGSFLISQCAAFRGRPSQEFIPKKLSFPVKMAKDEQVKSPKAGFVGGLGVAANMVCGYSLYVVKSTGCQVQNAKGGLEFLIAEQAASVIIVLSIVIWSAVTKAKTGSGLPAGPAGLLGAAEGCSYLSLLGGIVVTLLNFVQYGGLTSSECVYTEFVHW